MDVRFNDKPVIETIPLGQGQSVYVVDDVLDKPERLRAWAQNHQSAFANAPQNAFPGCQLLTPPAFTSQLDDYFRIHIRSRMGGWRNMDCLSRLAMVTLPPEQLQSRQWLCHRDRTDYDPRRVGIAASVLYLFEDARLGGTSFYGSKLSPADTEHLIDDQNLMEGTAFREKYGVAAGYMQDSNNCFERIVSVAPRWNRMIFYDGGIFHSADIQAPELLSEDPACGRLTLNGFFTYRKRAG